VVGEVLRADIELEGGVRAERLRVVALPGLVDRPLLGMDVLGRLHWQQREGVMRIDLRTDGYAVILSPDRPCRSAARWPRAALAFDAHRRQP